jgi:hypothetical protein
MTGILAMSTRTQFDPLGAGALLVGVLGVCIGAGAGIGAAFGSIGYGVAAGSLVGVPASIAAVVVRYRGV